MKPEKEKGAKKKTNFIGRKQLECGSGWVDISPWSTHWLFVVIAHRKNTIGFWFLLHPWCATQELRVTNIVPGCVQQCVPITRANSALSLESDGAILFSLLLRFLEKEWGRESKKNEEGNRNRESIWSGLRPYVQTHLWYWSLSLAHWTFRRPSDVLICTCWALHHVSLGSDENILCWIRSHPTDFACWPHEDAFIASLHYFFIYCDIFHVERFQMLLGTEKE